MPKYTGLHHHSKRSMEKMGRIIYTKTHDDFRSIYGHNFQDIFKDTGKRVMTSNDPVNKSVRGPEDFRDTNTNNTKTVIRISFEDVQMLQRRPTAVIDIPQFLQKKLRKSFRCWMNFLVMPL